MTPPGTDRGRIDDGLGKPRIATGNPAERFMNKTIAKMH